MKPLFRVLFAASLMTAATGCESFLDINDNPNQATAVLPSNQLANALTVTAANYTGAATNYNSYTSFVSGFWAKSGGVSGFTEEQTYGYTTLYQQNLWSQTYDNLNDYNLILQNGKANGFLNHAAIARIMMVYNFQLLVDQYGDVPYFTALKGAANTFPSYDKSADIYKDFSVQLKGAIADINAATTAGSPAVGNEDIVFRGNMKKWKQFANSLRLRVLLRQSQADAATVSYVNTEMTALRTEAAASTFDGFIATDVVAQPGYASNSNQQNPFYNRYGFAVGSANATSEYNFIFPTKYIVQQYESNSDPRITQLYRLGKLTIGGVATPRYVGSDLGESNPPNVVATNATVGSRFLQGGTFLRGAGSPTVLMLLSEQLFSQSEAESRNLLAGGDAQAKTDFLAGIRAAFVTTYRTTTDLATINASVITATTAGVPQADAYIAANATNGLVNWETTTTTVRQGQDLAETPLPTPRPVTTQEKILYQKYLASNTIASTEAWADFRRSGLPKFRTSVRPGANPLPKRLLYPQTEVSTNQANIPAGITTSTPIFWDVVD